MLGLSNNISNLSFKQESELKNFNPPVYTANQFITDLKKEEEKRLNGGVLSKFVGSPTAMYGSAVILLLGEIFCFAKIKSKKGFKFPSAELKKAFNRKILLVLSGIVSLGLAFAAIVQTWQNKIIDNKSAKPQEFLEKYGSDTSAKLADDNLRSLAIAAQHNPVNGAIEVNKNYIHDPIGKKLIEKCIKHELQHARQFEMIAGLENGIEKLNFASLFPVVRNVKKNPLALAQINNVIKEVNEDKSGLYDNLKVKMSGAEVDFKTYLKALEIMINDPSAKPEDVPIIIDVEHYKKALEKRGPLSEKEKIRAEEYYQAMLKYPIMKSLNLINPFSGYRTNILEKEARKAGRSKTGQVNA